MRFNLVFILVCSLLLPGALLLAHQPRIVAADTVRIRRPEVSQAFYGTLAGKPVTFIIESPEQFALHAALMAPVYDNGEAPHLSLEVAARDTTLFDLEAGPGTWELYHEFFTWDDYYQGPQRTIQVPPGRYFLKIDGMHQAEKYVLVVGTKESWPPGEILNTLVLLPRMKREFFGKSPWIAYFNPFSIMMFGGTALLIGLPIVLLK